MLGAGGMHELQVMAILTTHFRRILALEGADVGTEAEAAARLGMKGSTFPARKALGRARRLGREGSSRAVTLLADADVDLRGRTAWPEELVLEVLVARLARLSR
jgi:DNA polymerase-3 subunit delta